MQQNSSKISPNFQQNFSKISAKFQHISVKESNILEIEILFCIWSSIFGTFDEFFKNQDFSDLFGIKFEISQISDDQFGLALNRGFADEFYEGHFQGYGHLDFVYFTKIEWMKSAGFKNVILIFLWIRNHLKGKIDHVLLSSPNMESHLRKLLSSIMKTLINLTPVNSIDTWPWVLANTDTIQC